MSHWSHKPENRGGSNLTRYQITMQIALRRVFEEDSLIGKALWGD